MNEFTKEELEEIAEMMRHARKQGVQTKHDLTYKVEKKAWDLIHNYCEHEWQESIHDSDLDEQQINADTIGRSIATLDSIVISCREQQIALGKILAKEVDLSESDILQVLKDTSIQLLSNNGLEY